MANTGAWLRSLERKLGWLAVPQIGILLITLQVLGFLALSSNPLWFTRLILLPEEVWNGEAWRLITFLSIPLSMGPIWLLFALWFLYFIMNSIEQYWGAFKTTLYVLVSLVLTCAYSLAFGYPVTQAQTFESTLFLASAALYPEMEISLFMFIPVKMKWMGLFAGVFVILQFLQGDWLDRGYLLAMYSNFILFFGPGLLQSAKNLARRWNYRRKIRR